MSNNNDKDEKITLTDPDTGVTLSIPTVNVTEWDDSSKYISVTNDEEYTTITVDPNNYQAYVDHGFIDSVDLSSIYERPNEKTIRKRYTGHKKFDDLGDIGIHTLEKMSKRGN